ncbi:hypothetical protein [Clostridium grantii]|uniref:Nucleotidyltransferase domain-containing protein n=1 Tax=Clostridium grantii DSM 8605 TaxID=1121316 RepID=A0A1M5RBX1_9CLOT|nr:hypothetical protein [Clostridium grantii]SHH23668.1 hypothetical protein SAMN02745207_00438 [Clostridium grantii DSM 8605]
MKYNELMNALNKLKEFCNKNVLNFVVVGSVGYKNGESTEDCDDLDCVIIYDDVFKIESFPYIGEKLYHLSVESLKNNEIDLFATKFKIGEVKISIDFISIDYFDKLAKGKPCEKSEFLRKMTDAEERPINEYYDFYGNQLIYNKTKLKSDKFNIYILPKFIYEKDIFYSGVLHNKFMYNPQFLVVKNKEILDLHGKLLKNYVSFYNLQKQRKEKIDIIKSVRNWDRFSNESKYFINNLFQLE